MGSLVECTCPPQGHREDGNWLVHHWTCALSVKSGPFKRVIQPSQKPERFADPDPNQDPQRATTWRGDIGVHAEAIIDKCQQIGEPIRNANGDYVGLTYSRIIMLLDELHAHRQDKERLRKYMHEHFPYADNDTDPVNLIITAMDGVRDIIGAVLPHVATLWGNVSHSLRQCGVIPKEAKDGYRIG